MPTSKDEAFYAILDYIAKTVGDEDDFQQNKCVREEQFAQAIAEPYEAREVEAGKHHTSLAASTTDNPYKTRTPTTEHSHHSS